jgi:hypothetical protein
VDLNDYFDGARGMGILSTADADGKVNAAVYSRPHCFEDGTIGFVMLNRLTHHNLESNGHACYLFREDGSPGRHGYAGKRIYLSKLSETADEERISALRRRSYGDKRDGRFLVTFTVDKVLPLVGSGDDDELARAPQPS